MEEKNWFVPESLFKKLEKYAVKNLVVHTQRPDYNPCLDLPEVKPMEMPKGLIYKLNVISSSKGASITPWHPIASSSKGRVMLTAEELFDMWKQTANFNGSAWITLSSTIQVFWNERVERINLWFQLRTCIDADDLRRIWNDPIAPVPNSDPLFDNLVMIINAWGFPGTSTIADDAKKAEENPPDSLNERWIPVGTKFTFKASGLVVEVADSITGKAKLKIHKDVTDWMKNSDIQKEIKETI